METILFVVAVPKPKVPRQTKIATAAVPNIFVNGNDPYGVMVPLRD
jgi:hypothetical protein